MYQALRSFLESVVGEQNIRQDEPMDRHTSFRTGGNAACFIEPENAEQLAKVLSYLQKTEQDYFVLGNGSNLLVSDLGYDGVVIYIGDKTSKICVDGSRITVQAGALLSQTAHAAMEAGLTGMEFASGIPGSIGGAMMMNAGAYDGEMSRIVESVTVLDPSGESMILENETMEFGYRTSILKNRPFVVTEVTLRLQEGDREQIQAKMADFAARRREKQPLNYPSAGSTFKRPEGYFAGKLIMDSGLRGYRIGGAQVSEKHCGFIINSGNATSEDISELMDEVIQRVKERFGVTLEPEVIRLGRFG